MPNIYHRHDITGKGSYSGSGKYHNWNRTITRYLNGSVYASASQAQNYYPSYPGVTGSFVGGFYQNLEDTYIRPGYLYYSYPVSAGATNSYILKNKMLAILDVFYLRRYTFLSTTGFSINPAVTRIDNWVAWAIYNTSTGRFTGNYCTGTASRLDFNLTPLDSFADIVSAYNIQTAYSWSSITGVAAPTASYSTSFYTLKTGTTLSSAPGGQTIRIIAGHPTSQFLIRGTNLRFHGFLSYSSPFNATTYAFTTVAGLDSVNHTSAHISYGTSKYPTKNTETITHTVIPMCRLLTNSVNVSPYTSSIANAFLLTSGTGGAPTYGDVTATTVTNISTLVANPDASAQVTDSRTNATINIPLWMTGDIFYDDSVIFLESDNGDSNSPSVSFFDSGYYGTDVVYGYWDVEEQTWSDYVYYGALYNEYTVSDPFDGNVYTDPAVICSIPPDYHNVNYAQTIYVDINYSLEYDTQIYNDTALTNPFNGNDSWYYIGDASGGSLEPPLLYYISHDGKILDVHDCNKH